MACGGSPTTLGRSPDLTEFGNVILFIFIFLAIEIFLIDVLLVKHGKEKQASYVEVDIFLGNDILTIKRAINSETRGSKWTMNGAHATVQKVQTAMSGLSIDMDNLCSFMPQDKVGLFSQQTPQGILQKTLQAMVDPAYDNREGEKKTLYDIQKDLAKTENSKDEHLRNLNSKKVTKLNLEKQIAGMKTEIDRVKQREELKQKLEYYEIKKMVIGCQDVFAQLEAKQAIVDAANTALAAASDTIKPLEEAERKCKKKIQEIEQAYEGYIKKSNTHEEKCSTHRDAISNLDVNIDNILQQIEIMDDKRRNDQLKYDQSCKHIEKLETELQSALNAVNAVKQQITQLNQNISEKNGVCDTLQEAVNSLHHEFQEKNSELNMKIREMSNLKNATQLFKMKLQQIMKNQRPGGGPPVLPNQLVDNTFRAMDFIENNRHKFGKEVIGPLAMNIHVDNPACAAMFEKLIPIGKLLGFICLTEEDAKMLKQDFKQNNIKVDVYTMTNPQLNSYPPLPRLHTSSSSSSDAGLKVQHLAEQMKTTHDAIRSYLYMFNGVHMAFWIKLDKARHPANPINTDVS